MLVKKIYIVLYVLLFCCINLANAALVTVRLAQDPDDIHMGYAPVEVYNAETKDVKIDSFSVRIDQTASQYVKECEQPYCGQPALVQSPKVMCNKEEGTLLHSGERCYIWFTAINHEDWPHTNTGKSVITVQANLPTKEFVKGNFDVSVDYSLYAGTKDAMYKYNGNGSIWDNVIRVTGSSSQISSLKLFNGDLYLGGKFDKIVEGEVSTRNFAKWNGYRAKAFGDITGKVNALAPSASASKLYVGGDFIMSVTSNVGYWAGTSFNQGSGSAKEAVYGISDDILTTKRNTNYPNGLIVDTGNTLIRGVLDNDYQAINVSHISAITKANDGEYCVGGSSSNNYSVYIECFRHTKGSANLTAITGEEFWGDTRTVSINVLDTNQSMNAVIAGGHMTEMYSASGTELFNIVYSKKDKLNQWIAFDNGVNSDVYALANSGPYEFVGGAFDRLCSGITCDSSSTMPHIGYFKMNGNPGKPAWNVGGKTLPGLPDTVYSLVMAQSIKLTEHK